MVALEVCSVELEPVVSRLTSAVEMVLIVPSVLLLVVVTAVDRSCHVCVICRYRLMEVPPVVPEVPAVVVDRAVPVSREVKDLLVALMCRHVRCLACRCRRSTVLPQTE